MLLLARRARAVVVNPRRRYQQQQQPPSSPSPSRGAKVHRRWASHGQRSGPLTRGVAVGPSWSSSSSIIEIQRPRHIPHLHSRQTIRGKKTKTVVSLDDLPQGLILPTQEENSSKPNGKTTAPPPPQPLEDWGPPSSPSYPTVVLQARRNMQKFDNCVLLTRVGGFYELYFEHAEEYGPLMNLKVAQKKTAAGPVPMVKPPELYSPFPLPPPSPSLSCI